MNRHAVSTLALIALAAAAACSTTTVAASTTVSCTSPLTLTLGQVIAGLSGSSVCVTASTAAAEYALIPFNGATTSTTATFDVSSFGSMRMPTTPASRRRITSDAWSR
jgi:hypothetical protein